MITNTKWIFLKKNSITLESWSILVTYSEAFQSFYTSTSKEKFWEHTNDLYWDKKLVPAWHLHQEQADMSLYWKILKFQQHDEQFLKTVLAKSCSYQYTPTSSSAILSHWKEKEQRKRLLIKNKKFLHEINITRWESQYDNTLTNFTQKWVITKYKAEQTAHNINEQLYIKTNRCH